MFAMTAPASDASTNPNDSNVVGVLKFVYVFGQVEWILSKPPLSL